MANKWISALTLLLLALLTQVSCQTAFAKDKIGTETKLSLADQLEISVRNVLIALENSCASKNAETAAMQFAADALFIDQTGEETRGRQSLQSRFELLFKNGSAAVGIHPESITFPAENVALIVGEVSHRQELEELPATRFSMVMIKINNNWLISEVTETALQAAQAESQMRQLEWLIGSWTTDKSESFVEFNVEWAPGKKFLTSKCILNKNGKTPEVDNQTIGWDPQRRSIVSWHFDSNGGFGNGIWSQQPKENTWTVDVTGVGADGSNTTASNTFLQKTAGEFVWQSIHRSSNGIAVDDTEPITVHRVKP